MKTTHTFGVQFIIRTGKRDKSISTTQIYAKVLEKKNGEDMEQLRKKFVKKRKFLVL